MELSEKILSLVKSDPAAKLAVDSLSPFGEIYVVGGAPRDILLGKKPKDIDLMAKVSGDTIESVLKNIPNTKVNLTGKQFPVYRLNYQGSEVEIALPRIETKTGEGNKDWKIISDSSIPVEKDLERRDFTANSIAVNAKTGKVVDPFNGMQDIEKGILKTVSPTSFRDDSSRTLRALTALSKNGLQPDEETMKQMREYAPYLKNIPAETIGQELEKIISGNHPADALTLAHKAGVLKHFLPEIDATFGFDQKNPHHRLDLGNHIMNVLHHSSKISNDPDVRISALLHDVGKPSSMWVDETGRGRFFKGPNGEGANHEEVGAEMAEGILSRLRYPTNRIGKIKQLVRNHMFDEFNTPKGARKFLNSAGSFENAMDQLDLKESDHMGKGNPNATTEMVDKMRNLVEQEKQNQSVFSPKDLAINGRDIMKILGVSSGPQVGEIIKKLMDMVIQHPALNNRQELLNLVQTMYGGKVSMNKYAENLHPDFHVGVNNTYQKDDGFTWNSDFSRFDGDGFGVGLHEYGQAHSAKNFSPKDVERFKKENIKLLNSDPSLKIGSWNDTDGKGNGLIYLDIVKIYPNQMDAMRSALAEQQIAFYDFGSGKVINTQPDIAHEYPTEREDNEPNPEHLQENYDTNAVNYG